jgi:hypothetical protein
MFRATIRGELRCEGCNEPVRLDWAHLFGRGNVIAEPWCSLPELTAALCRSCHRSIDTAAAPGLRSYLRTAALALLATRFAPLLDVLAATQETPLDALDQARAAERILEAELPGDALPDFAPSWR